MEIPRETAETKPPDAADIRLCPAHLYLLAATVGVVLHLGTLAADRYTHVDVHVGVYLLLSQLSIGGGCGWMLQSVEARNRRELGRELAAVKDQQRQILNELAELRGVLDGLTEMIGRPRVTYLHGPTYRTGRRYVGTAAVVGESGAAVAPVPVPGTGLDAETIAAARTVARRLLEADTLPRQRVPE
jgi:hypothetical protein